MSKEQVRRSHESPPWNRSTKTIVAIVALILTVILAWRFQSIIAQIIGAAILAYILNPVIIILDERTPLKRGTSLILVYLLLATGIIWALIALGVAAFQQVSNFIDLIPNLVTDITSFVEGLTSRTEPIYFVGVTIDPNFIPWEEISNQILGFVEPLASRGTQLVGQIASTTVRWLGILFFVFMISIYIANEIPRLGSYVGDFAHQPGYRDDAERLVRDFGRIWSAYLRGQVILGFIIFLVVWVGLAALGVRNSLALGLIAGLLEFIPNIGPLISAGIAIVVAFFQPTNYLALEPWQFALAVLALMFFIQQLENNLLVPRIVGEALDLHPLVVIVGVFMGGSLAGVLGAVLAAPVIATGKLLGTYGWRKMFDLEPFPKPEPEGPAGSSMRVRVSQLRTWLANRMTKHSKK